MTRIGNNFVRTLGSLLGFPGGETIREVSDQIALTVPLEASSQWGLGTYGRFWKVISATAAANPNSFVTNPQNAGNWDQIDFGTNDGVVTRAGVDQWLMNFGMFVEVPGNFTEASFFLRGGPSNQELLLWHGSSVDDGGHVLGTFVPQTPISLKTLNNNGSFPRVDIVVSGNTDVTVIADVLSGPIGLFQRK